MNLKFHTQLSPKYSICEEDIFGVIKEHNYYLNNMYASHVQRFQIIIHCIVFIFVEVCVFVVEVCFNFFLYIVFTPICFVKGEGGSCFIDVICIYKLSPELLLLDITRKYFWGTSYLSQHKPTIARNFPYFIYSRIFRRSTTKLNITIKTVLQKSSN
jgi:hypothetical protein